MLAGTTFNDFAEALGRGLRGLGRAQRVPEDEMSYDPVPQERVDIVEAVHGDAAEPLAREEKLRASERLERDTMMLIRGALYPAD